MGFEKKMYAYGWGNFINMYVHGGFSILNSQKEHKNVKKIACGAKKLVHEWVEEEKISTRTFYLLKKSVHGWVCGGRDGTWVGGFPRVEIDHRYPAKYQVPPPGFMYT